jgi:hypothetical protein
MLVEQVFLQSMRIITWLHVWFHVGRNVHRCMILYRWSWWVDAMTYQFQQVLEGLLIFDSFFNRWSKFKVDFSEVHTNSLWSHRLEEILNEVEWKPIFLSGASRSEAARVNWVYVERNPVLIVSFLKVLRQLSLNRANVIFVTLRGFKDQDIFILDKLELLRLIRPDAEVANLFRKVETFPLRLSGNHARQVR